MGDVTGEGGVTRTGGGVMGAGTVTGAVGGEGEGEGEGEGREGGGGEESSIFASSVAGGCVAAFPLGWEAAVIGATSEITRMLYLGTTSAPATAAAYDKGRGRDGEKGVGREGEGTVTVYEME
jgi:hypothetical protein